MVPNQPLTRQISIIFRRASFCIFKKMDLGFLGQNKRISDELEVLKTQKIFFVVSLAFLVAK